MSKAMFRNRKYARTVRIFDPELRLLTERAYGHLLTAGYDVRWISERSCEVLEFKDLDYFDLKFLRMDIRTAYRESVSG
jgi:hypothetical protein